MILYKSKFLFTTCFFVSIFVIVSSCATSKTSTPREISQIISDGESSLDGEGNSTTKCNSYSEDVSIKELEFVDSNNVGNYTLKGVCEHNDKLVQITVNGYKTSLNPICDNRRWEANLNLTSVSTEKETMTFQVTHNNKSICKKVRVAFLGPKNYIPIPPLDDYYESGFFVMKYEAKLEGQNSDARAISSPKELPLTRISYNNAVDLCRNNGSRYDLMKNSQWQNIARSIENEDKNWSEGQATPSDYNTLNCGVYNSTPQEASSDDQKDCATSSCNSGWDENRRTHLLINETRIWDICGNVGEIMKNKYTKNANFNDYIFELSSDLKKLFGPKRTYSSVDSNQRSNTWNLGYAKITSGKNMIVRGMADRDAGIFSVDITRDQTDTRTHSQPVGFRCVYIP